MKRRSFLGWMSALPALVFGGSSTAEALPELPGPRPSGFEGPDGWVTPNVCPCPKHSCLGCVTTVRIEGERFTDQDLRELVRLLNEQCARGDTRVLIAKG